MPGQKKSYDGDSDPDGTAAITLREVRKSQVAAGRAAGKSFSQISRELGWSVPTVMRDAAEVSEDLRVAAALDIDTARHNELAHLYILRATLYDRALAGDDDQAIDRLLSIHDRIAKISDILPTNKLALTDPSGKNEYGSLTRDEKLERLARRIELGRYRRTLGLDTPAAGGMAPGNEQENKLVVQAHSISVAVPGKGKNRRNKTPDDKPSAPSH